MVKKKIMYELEEKGYFYLLLVIPALTVLFLYIQYWKKKKQREFGDLDLIKKLSPEKSVFKSVFKLVLVLLGLTFLIMGLINPKIGKQLLIC